MLASEATEQHDSKVVQIHVSHWICYKHMSTSATWYWSGCTYYYMASILKHEHHWQNCSSAHEWSMLLQIGLNRLSSLKA